MSAEPATKLAPWKEVMAGSNPTRYAPKTERKLDLSSFRVIKLVNARFAAAVGYRNYRSLNKSSRYGDDVARELRKMTERIVVQMKDRTFYWIDAMSVLAFLQDFKSVRTEFMKVR